MTDFDLSTSYENDYELADFIEAVTWENASGERVTGLQAKFSDFDHPEALSVAGGLTLSSETAAVVVWQPKTPTGEEPNVLFAPHEGHVLRRESQGGQGWIIRAVQQSRFGHWVCTCEREVTNG